MRTLALAAACSGCVITAPDGEPQVWPMSLGGVVETVVAGDLDANGSSDIVVMVSGDDNQAGFYYLESDTDIRWGTGVASSDIVPTFSRFVPFDLVDPVGAYLDAAVVPRLYVATGTDVLTLTSFTNQLSETASTVTGVPGSGSAWVGLMTFPGAMPHAVVSNGAQIEHLVASTLDDPRPLPALGAPSWNSAQTATSYTDGGNEVAVVAAAEAIYRVVIPTMGSAGFPWEVVRTGAPWLGQTTHDFDGDGRAEILGFDPQARAVCVVDPGAVVIPVASPSCVTLTSAFMGTDVTIIAGVNLSQNAGLDILVIQASGMDTGYSLVEDVEYNAGILTPANVRTIPFMGPPGGNSVVVKPSAASPNSVLTFGTDGTVVCALGPC